MGIMLSRAEIVEMIVDANVATSHAGLSDGTFLFSGDRLYRIESLAGYEVAYGPCTNPAHENPQAYLSDGDRIGFWYNAETEVWDLDRTMLIVGPRDMAATIAGALDQQSFWGWAERDCFTAERV